MACANRADPNQTASAKFKPKMYVIKCSKFQDVYHILIYQPFFFFFFFAVKVAVEVCKKIQEKEDNIEVNNFIFKGTHWIHLIDFLPGLTRETTFMISSLLSCTQSCLPALKAPFEEIHVV